ncbi:GTPase [Staphylococcus aureus]
MAGTDRASKVAMNQIEGRLSDLIKKQRQSILEILAQVEVNIDYPEYDDVEDATTEFLFACKEIKQEINRLLDTGAQGKIMREGLSTVIVGKPNVGKSSMLNNLIQDNKAIVTEVAGTTRDVLEEYVNVRGVPLRLVDTAGIRETEEDIVEKIGVERSRKALSQADLILFVLNNNEALTQEDYTLYEVVKNEDVIVIVNKMDLEQNIDINEVKDMIGDTPLIQTSMLKQEGIDELEIQIQDFFGGEVQNQDMTYVSNSRSIFHS